jgi:hypothetical protein
MAKGAGKQAVKHGRHVRSTSRRNAAETPLNNDRSLLYLPSVTDSRTFAHSGTIVNNKGGNIFVVRHLGISLKSRKEGVDCFR